MKIKEAAKILKEFNEWRRSDEFLPPVPATPKEIGIAIDVVVKYVEDFESADYFDEVIRQHPSVTFDGYHGFKVSEDAPQWVKEYFME